MEKNCIKLTKKLIALPSYLDNQTDEREILLFLESFFNENFPALQIRRQFIKDSNRYNLLIKGKNNPTLFVLGHVDTVKPKTTWTTNPLQAVIKNDKLYGLGTADMKGSLAAFLTALTSQKEKFNVANLMLLFYVDEEYDFKGMKTFIENKVALNPALIISLDGTLEVASGCRGLIEIDFRLKGKSGHAANPKNGINAITQTLDIITALTAILAKKKDKYLGKTTLNVAAIRGGTQQEKGGEEVWQSEGNIIPDTVDIKLEIRPATIDCNATYVVESLTKQAEKRGLIIEQINIRHDIRSWSVAYDQQELKMIQQAYKQANVAFKKSNRKYSSYIDAQMIAEKINPPIFIIGTGGENKHGADENVPIKNIINVTKVYQELLRIFLK